MVNLELTVAVQNNILMLNVCRYVLILTVLMTGYCTTVLGCEKRFAITFNCFT